MATANSTLPFPRNIAAMDAADEAREVVRALDALEFLACGDEMPRREDLASLFRIMREALELRLQATIRAASGEV